MYELKTSQIFIFTYHDNHFFIMDDSWYLKQFTYDKKAQKLKAIRTYEFSSDSRALLSNSIDFEPV